MTQSHTYLDADFTVVDGIAHFKLNRPDILNALTDELQADFTQMVTQVQDSTEIRALIISAAGRAFSAGGNVKGMQGSSRPDEFRDRVRRLHRWLKPLYNLSCPVIAAVDGLAYGGGLALVLAADFVLASPKARFSAVFGRIGLIPDMALLHTLPRVVGMQRAKELMYTARSIHVEEAKSLGLVLEIHPSEQLDAAALMFAQRLAQGSNAAMALTKLIVNRSFESDYDTLAELEANGQAMMRATEFHNEAVRRFVAKQPSLFNWDDFETEASG